MYVFNNSLQLVVVGVKRRNLRLKKDTSATEKIVRGRYNYLETLASTDFRDNVLNLAAFVEWC